MVTPPDSQEPDEEPTKREAAYARACLVLGSEFVERERGVFDEFVQTPNESGTTNYDRWRSAVAKNIKPNGASEEDVDDALQEGLKGLWMDVIVWMAKNPKPPRHLQDFIDSLDKPKSDKTAPNKATPFKPGSGFDARLLWRCQSRYDDAARKAKGLKRLPASSNPSDAIPKPNWYQRMFPMTPEIERQAAQTEDSLDDEGIEHLQVKLSEALQTLKPEDSALLLARYGDPRRDEVPYEELAPMFCITVVAVGARIRRAQVKLKNYFERHGISDFGSL